MAELRDAAGQPLPDRTAAERLVNTRLYVGSGPPARRRRRTISTLSDLVGHGGPGPAGAALGRVTVVHDYGAGASLEIERPGAAPLLVPFTRACVPEVDLAAGTLVVAEPDEILVDDATEAAE